MDSKELKEVISARRAIISQWGHEKIQLEKAFRNISQNARLVRSQIDTLDSCIEELKNCVSTDRELLDTIETYDNNNKKLEKVGIVESAKNKKTTQKIDDEDPRKLDLE